VGIGAAMKEQFIDMTRFSMFGRPSIPTGLVVMVTIVILTQAAVLLMNQSAAYWLNPQYATDVPFGLLLQSGPMIYFVILILYMAVVGLLLSKLNTSMGLPLAAGLVFIHSLGLFKATLCGFYPLYEPHGAISCYSYGYVPLILISTVFGLILLGGRLPERFIYWNKRILIPFAVLWIMLMGYGIFRAAFPPNSPWKPLAPVHSPGPRTLSAIAYDSKRQRAVLFGGITLWNGDAWVYDSSTWEWDGKDWSQIETPVAPAGRILHAMAYDEQRGKVILYGGQNASRNLADLWEWDGVTWHRLCPVCNPAVRFSHKMIFDTERHEIMIYGGQDGKAGFAEAWIWNRQGWTYFQFENSTPGVYNAPLIYESNSKRAVSFMGRDWGGTWIWEGNKWLKLNLAVQPPVRDEAVLVYDPVQKVSILFGGTNDNKFLFNDTWILDGETWVKLDTPSAPPQRSKAVAFYDPVRHSIILYGGERFGSAYSDMWELILPDGDQ
jgi:hypothetical protein